jgi:4-hydroxybutyrate CoA-transferase
VTEYGVAHLKWKTNRDRAKALISIAAPEFREALKYEYNQLYGEIL